MAVRQSGQYRHVHVPDGEVIGGRHAREPASSTLPPSDRSSLHWLEQGLRWTALAVAAAVVGAGLVGWLGVRTRTATGGGERLELEVDHASIARPGVVAPMTVDVSAADGAPLPSIVRLEITSDYLGMFEQGAPDIDPARAWSTGDASVFEYEIPPGGDELSVSFGGRVDPTIQLVERAGDVTVTASDGRDAAPADADTVTAHVETRVLP